MVGDQSALRVISSVSVIVSFYFTLKTYLFYFIYSFLQNTYINLFILHIYSIKYLFFYYFLLFLYSLPLFLFGRIHYPFSHIPNTTKKTLMWMFILLGLNVHISILFLFYTILHLLILWPKNQILGHRYSSCPTTVLWHNNIESEHARRLLNFIFDRTNGNSNLDTSWIFGNLTTSFSTRIIFRIPTSTFATQILLFLICFE